MNDLRISAGHLEKVTDRASLFAFLKNNLGWPVSEEDPFTYDVPVLDDVPQSADVTRIVPFTANDPYLLILAEFKKPILRGSLRRILQGIRSDIRKRAAYNQAGLESIVFICAEPSYAGIRFAHFTEKEGRQPKLSVFGWEQDRVYETRTLREFNLPNLRLATDLYGIPVWSGSTDRWRDAWKVEEVTKRFFGRFEELFNQAIDPELSLPKNLITGLSDDPLRLFAQRLFNRLLFIRFLERKGWLSYNGRQDYLMALWEDYQQRRTTDDTFYTDRLQPLFFSGLNRPASTRTARETALIGDVPYLNGGLFEQEEDEKNPRIAVPDAAVEDFLTGLLYDYNFTVTESTPDDEDVAVDPEMLGKVFERLVNKDKRHSTGSYYTPRPIVSFMCREALKGVLPGHDDLIDRHSVEGIDVETARRLLADTGRLRVLDPACGSGAYLLGMLHEINTIMSLLDTAAEGTAREDYDRKLDIIHSTLYGVDREQFAVNIARLRLWLSLAVDYTGDVPEPLPNLDFKVERGDSLTAPNPEGFSGAQGLLGHKATITALDSAKKRYQNAHTSEEKAAAFRDVEYQRREIDAWWPDRKVPAGAFDWPLEFAEVFADGGFDIVLANPPYVRQEELGREYKEGSLRPAHPEVYAGTADLYVYFYSRAVQCLKPGGMLAFISSNKWFRAGYGAKLREHIAGKCSILSITDFGELPVFETAATFPMIFVARKGKVEATTRFTQVKSITEEPYPDVLTLIREQGQELPPEAINGSEWRLTDLESINIIRKMETSGVPLGEYVDGRIYRGVLTGFNKAFIIDGTTRAELIRQDPNSAEIIKPLAVGDDIRKWHIRERDRWLIVTKIGADMKRYPAVMKHLRQWQTELEDRWDKGEHWWELRPCAYYAAFDEPKIVFPDIAKEPRFAFDRSSTCVNNTTYFIPGAEPYLSGILNSDAVWSFAQESFTALGDPHKGGRLRFIYQHVVNIPIPNAPASDREAISALVEKCLSAKGVACEAWEAEINERVARLYGL